MSQLGVVVLVRNEIDVIGTFLAHIAALFDHVLLLDHGSSDGTEHALAHAARARPGWTSWRVDVSGYHQARFTTFAMRHLFGTTDVDTVFFLDADEFIDVPDRAALDASLAAVSGPRTAPQLDWVDCIPDRLDADALRADQPIWSRLAPSPYPKIAMPRALWEATGRQARPSAGNHTIEAYDGLPTATHPIGRLLHLPLRSLAQMRLKIMTGALGVRARTDNAAHENSHWFNALRRMAETGLREADLIGIAATYGNHPARWPELTTADLAGLGFSRRRLDVAHAPVAIPEATPRDPWRVLAALVGNWHAADGAALYLVLQDGVLSSRPSALP